nr:putative ribonuclease H-like domain-containing protein [Tanacetum cinerariifolium]
MPPKPCFVFYNALDDVETDHPAFTVKLSPTKPDQDLSHTIRPSAPIIEDWVFDSEDESETKTPQHVPSFVQPIEQVKSPRHSKIAQPTARNHAHRGNHKHYAQMTLQTPQRHVVPAAIVTQSKPVSITTARPVSTAVPKIKVTRPRHAKYIVTKTNSPTRRYINHSPSLKASNSPPRVTAVKAPMVNAAQGVIDSGCSRNMIGNMSYLSDLEELNGRYVAFGGNPKGGKIFGKEFEDFFDNSINEINAAGTLVPTVGQISPNNTNTFSAASTSNVVASPTHDKTSCIYASQLSDDPNMLELEDITYSDDEDDVGAEVDFNNLETSITEEILQFKMQNVWILVDLLYGKRAIGTKWVFRNKKDERGIVVRNKARLVTQGHIQEERIDYEEVFAPVARIEAIRLFLAYASFMGFMVYQMDVKSAFLYGTIEEEAYVCQPPGFENPDYPDKVYKVVKALYGLHQAPRAWYETLANYLRENGFQRGKIDQTLFIKRQKGDILLVHIYVDDIIFGLTNKDLCKYFEKLIKDKFQMSSMRELTFFLGLQVKQKKDVIFISQDKYVAEILRKFGLIDRKLASTPIDTEKPLLKDPDDSDYAGASLDRKSTTERCQFLRCRLISWQCKKQTVMATSSTKAEYVMNCTLYYSDENLRIVIKEAEEEDKNEEIYSTTNDETKDISASTPSSPRSIQLQELINQVLLR